MELKDLRNQIDGIDRELVDLFVRRMHVSAQVAEYKRAHGLPVLDAQREAALLERISAMAGDEMEASTRALYATILEQSRAYQEKALGTEVNE